MPIIPRREQAGSMSPLRAIGRKLKSAYVYPMFRIFQQTSFEPPHYGERMWAPLACALDFVGGIFLILALLLIARIILPLVWN